jgi:Lysophospholipase L1 and related esterases
MKDLNQKNRVLPCLVFFGLCLIPFSLSAKTIMIVGDSISAGYGMQPQQGWVHLLQKRLDQHYPKQHKVVNASVSGETTSGALARLPKLLQTHRPDIVVIELGGNDGLRGQPPQMIQKNLAALVQQSQKAKANVVVFGMKMPQIMARHIVRLLKITIRWSVSSIRSNYYPSLCKVSLAIKV